jgi:hypothetical protein
MPKRTDLKALRNLVSQADKLLSTTILPEGRSERAHELLGAAIALADALLESPADPAAILGAKGGRKTAERGPEYFKKIAGMRKTKGGGRPRKT